MRTFLFASLLVFLCATVGLSEPADQLAKLQEYKNYGSRLAYAKSRLLIRKHGLESTTWYEESGYSLYSDLYGGLYSPEYRREGELDLYTGRKAVEHSVVARLRPTREASGERSLSLSEIEPVTVRSHPWKEMLAEVEPGPELSSLFELAPRDCFVVYFQKGSTIGELERGLKSVVDGADILFNFQQSLSATEMIAKRLGVENFRELEPLMGETLFISEDLDFYPNTHYALVFKGDSLSQIGANLLLDSPAQGRVGEAFVLATSKELFAKIEAASRGEVASLARAEDLKYCNAVLDHQRDGFCYLSEAFISKLVFPANRINSERRQAAVEGLVERQYSVLAYRTLTNEWPDSFQQMVRENYLPENPDDGDYLIHPDGRVEHKVWGTLYDLKALSEVPVHRVSEAERDQYERFRKGYDRLWTRFFDPVGVAFDVKEKMRFHTVVLPLVNSREYNLLQLISGGDPTDLKTLSYPYLESPASLHLKLNTEDILLALNNSFRPVADDADREVEKEKANTYLRKQYNFDESFDLFAIFGDELCLTYGEDVRFQGWDRLDIVACLELKDPEAFRQLTGKLLTHGFKREEKSLHGIDYVEISSGDGDPALYVLYHGDFVHMTLYQPALDRLCQQLAEPAQPAAWFDSAWVGETQNVLFRADLRKTDALIADALDPSRSYHGRSQMKHAIGYMTDFMLLEQSLGKDQAEKFFRCPPRSLYGIPLSVKNGEVYLGDVPADKVDLLGYYSPAENEPEPEDGARLVDLVQKYRNPQALAKMQLFQQASVGMSFTPEGLSTRVSINNPAYSPSVVEVPGSSDLQPLMLGLGMVGVMLLGWSVSRRKKSGPRQDIVS